MNKNNENIVELSDEELLELAGGYSSSVSNLAGLGSYIFPPLVVAYGVIITLPFFKS